MNRVARLEAVLVALAEMSQGFEDENKFDISQTLDWAVDRVAQEIAGELRVAQEMDPEYYEENPGNGMSLSEYAAQQNPDLYGDAPRMSEMAQRLQELQQQITNADDEVLAQQLMDEYQALDAELAQMAG